VILALAIAKMQGSVDKGTSTEGRAALDWQ